MASHPTGSIRRSSGSNDPSFCKKDSADYDVARCQRFRAQKRNRSDRFDQREDTEVQTLIFEMGFFTREQAIAWAKDHGFKSEKVDETEDSFRLRQQQPGRFQANSFRTIEFMGVRGIQAVIGRRK